MDTAHKGTVEKSQHLEGIERQWPETYVNQRRKNVMETEVENSQESD